MILSEKTSAELENLKPAEIVDGCLTRDEKEKIVTCFQENALCHTDLAKVIAPPAIETSWESYALALLGGVVGGMVLNQQLRH